MTLICCVCIDNDHSLPWIENDGQDQGLGLGLCLALMVTRSV